MIRAQHVATAVLTVAQVLAEIASLAASRPAPSEQDERATRWLIIKATRLLEVIVDERLSTDDMLRSLAEAHIDARVIANGDGLAPQTITWMRRFSTMTIDAACALESAHYPVF